MNFQPNIEGIFQGLPETEYRQAPGVNISNLKAMSKSPAHYLAGVMEKREPTPAMVFGTLLHLAALEPDKLAGAYVTRPEGMMFTTKEGKAWRDSQKAPILTADEATALEACRKSVLAHPAAQAVLAAADKEVSVFANHAETGLLRKGRIDAIATSEQGETWIADIKTTDDASEAGFCWSIANYGYDQQAAFYLDLIGASHFLFIAVEKTAPYAVAVYELDAESIAKGREKYQENLHKLKRCMDSGEFPAYSQEIQTIGLPKWAK
jgi:exodeoxyribonuclease VIII